MYKYAKYKDFTLNFIYCTVNTFVSNLPGFIFRYIILMLHVPCYNWLYCLIYY